MKAIVTCILIILSTNSVFAACSGSSPSLTSASATQTDVEACLTAATTGDTISVPSGSGSWSGMSIAQAVTLQGSGIGLTTIELSGSNSITKQEAGIITLSGFRFTKTGGGTSSKGFIISGSWKNAEPVIFKDNDFVISNAGLFHISIPGGVIIANNSFTADWNDSIFQIYDVDDAEGSWTTTDSMGTHDTDGKLNIYIESNTFYGGTNQGIDADDGARVVYRYNDLVYSSFNSHGKATSPIGIRHFEIYENMMHYTTCPDAICNQNWHIWIKGGTGVMFNNAIDDINGSDWGQRDELRFSARGAEDVRPQGTCEQVSYPVPHQIGQGNNGSNDFLDPIYIWGNTGTQGIDANWHWGNPCSLTFTDFFQLNRDYYTDGTEKPGYTPYTYPHPLVSGGEAAPSPAVSATGSVSMTGTVRIGP